MNKLKILIILYLIILSCTGSQESLVEKDKSNHKDSSNLYSEINYIHEQENHTDETLKLFENFGDSILKDNLRIHQYLLNDKILIRFRKQFKEDGLKMIHAFSDKRYPKKINPNQYHHFIVIVLEYEDILLANNAFSQFENDVNIINSLEEFPHANDRINIILGISKNGGLVGIKNKYLFTLVETCRDTPIGGTWRNYENIFINNIYNENDTNYVFNANCGKLHYNKQKIKD